MFLGVRRSLPRSGASPASPADRGSGSRCGTGGSTAALAFLPIDHGETMPSKPLEPGDPLRLARFELLGRLGEGGQGVVYLGRGAGPGGERVRVKVLRSSVDAT